MRTTCESGKSFSVFVQHSREGTVKKTSTIDPALIRKLLAPTPRAISPSKLVTPQLPEQTQPDNSQTNHAADARDRFEAVIRLLSTQRVHSHFVAFFTLLFFFSMRVSELRQLTRRDVIDSQTLLVRATKHSRSYTISHPTIAVLLANPIQHPRENLFPFSYWTYRRIALRIGFHLPPKLNFSRRRVLHAPRTVRASLIRQHEFTSEVLQDVLRHNSKRSQDAYKL
jgi:integrase